MECPEDVRNRFSVMMEADKSAWCHLIEKNVKPRPDLAGALALDTKLEEALKSYEVSFSLLPMIAKQTQKVAAPAATPVAKTHAAPSAKGNRKGLNRFRPYTAKGKGKSKGKFDQRIPKEIRDAGGTASTPDGEPICFDYSLKKCKEVVTDGRCRKGYHLCCICYGQHSMADHKRS